MGYLRFGPFIKACNRMTFDPSGLTKTVRSESVQPTVRAVKVRFRSKSVRRGIGPDKRPMEGWTGFPKIVTKVDMIFDLTR